MSIALFLCTGNYYRSRFAELLFNHLAEQRGCPWRAESRGLRLCPQNVGPISPHIRPYLHELGIAIDQSRYPRLVSAEDLSAARCIVAIKEAEHRPLLSSQFPQWLDRIEFWAIDDVQHAPPHEAVPLIRIAVVELFDRLSRSQ